MIFGIPSDAVSAWWPQVKPHIERFCSKTKLADPGEVLYEVLDCTKQLWGVKVEGKVVGFLLTEVRDQKRGRVLCIWAAAGDSDDPAQFVTIYDALETWGRSIGCNVVEVRGRRGWKKMLPGFRETGVLLEKVLT